MCKFGPDKSSGCMGTVVEANHDLSRWIPVVYCKDCTNSLTCDDYDVQGLELKDGDLCTMEGMTQKFLGEEGVVVGFVSSHMCRWLSSGGWRGNLVCIRYIMEVDKCGQLDSFLENLWQFVMRVVRELFWKCTDQKLQGTTNTGCRSFRVWSLGVISC